MSIAQVKCENNLYRSYAAENTMYGRLISIVVSVVVTFSYAAFLISAQMREHNTGGVTGSAYSSGWIIYGWPTIYRAQYTRYELPLFRIDDSEDNWSFPHLAINTAVLLVLTCSVGVATWCVTHFCRHRRTFSIAFLLTVMTSIGAAFVLNNGLNFLAELHLNKEKWWTPYETTLPLRVFSWIGLFCLSYFSIVIGCHFGRFLSRKLTA